MWLWSTLFDLAKTLFRGIGCVWFGLIALVMFGGLVTTLLGAAVMHGARDSAELAAEAASDGNYDAWERERDRRRARRASVAAQWERDRREAEYYDKYRSSEYDDY